MGPRPTGGMVQRQGARLSTSQRQERRQQQRLALTPRMRQSLALLQMPAQLLDEYLQQQAVENPVIDLDGLSEPDLDWEAGLGYAALDETDKFATAYAPETLRDSLLLQAGALNLEKPVRQVIEYLINSLDERGYLPEDMVPSGIANPDLRVVFARGLSVLKSLEPAGIGAHNLQECLKLQLARISAPEVCYLLVEECLEQLAAGSVRLIAARLGVALPEAVRCCEIVSSLQPIPARGSNTSSDARYVKPEAVVRATEAGGLTVERVTAWTDKIRIAEPYAGDLAGYDDAAAAYVAKHVKLARQLIDDVRLREDTVSRVISVIVERQSEALFDGRAALVPMTMEEVAEQLGVNVSTVSRAVQDKWLLAPYGMMAMRSFFTKATFVQEGAGDGRAISNEAVKARMSELISAEDAAHPLSDQAMCDTLVNEGIDISRRTVAKYREAMGIPGASKRKRR